MRIKKKHVLLESTLLDRSDEFTPHEKKVLKILHRKYSHDVNVQNFSIWETAAWLIEELGMTYEQAYSLTNTYYWNHRQLFKETEPLRKHIGIPYLFFENLSTFRDNFINSLPNDILGVEVPIKINGDTLFPERQVHVWMAHRGFNLYIPFRLVNHYIDGRIEDDRLFNAKIKLYALTINDEVVDGYINSDDWETLVNDKEFRVDVSYEIGRDASNQKIGELMSFNVPYPSTLNFVTASDILGDIINDVVEKISKTTFDLPDGIAPLNVDNPLD